MNNLVVEFSYCFRVVKLSTVEFLRYCEVCDVLVVGIDCYSMLASQKVVLVLLKA